MNEKKKLEAKEEPYRFAYIFKNIKSNQLVFTNKILSSRNYVLLNKTMNDINSYDDMLMLHD